MVISGAAPVSTMRFNCFLFQLLSPWPNSESGRPSLVVASGVAGRCGGVLRLDTKGKERRLGWCQGPTVPGNVSEWWGR